MLSTDFALGFSVTTAETPAGAPVAGYLNQICGPYSVNGNYGCTNGITGKGLNTTAPPTLNLVLSYVSDNQLFLNNFAQSFYKMVAVGYGTTPANGKLGILTNIDLTIC